jgi:polysaccharide pyruvyl transferase WcaK-like protein
VKDPFVPPEHLEDSTRDPSSLTMSTSRSYSLIVAVKSEHRTVLENTLLKSPDIGQDVEVILKWDYPCVSSAYNQGISEANGDILIFVHSDVYLPKGWLERLEKTIEGLERNDANWGVLGVFGVTSTGQLAGHVYSTGLKRMLGGSFDDPLHTLSLDELLLVTRRSSGLRFDGRLPGFHLYGTDICLEAKRKNLKSYIISAFCVHNSIGVRYLSLAFWRAYVQLRRKWWTELPIRTCCTTISRSYWPVISSLRTALHRCLFFSSVGNRHPEPERLCQELLTTMSTTVTSVPDRPVPHATSRRAAGGTDEVVLSRPRAMDAKIEGVFNSRPSHILILGAGFDTGNLGVSALAAGAIKCALSRFPNAQVSLLDYGKESKVYSLPINAQSVSVPLINIRFSKRVWLSNNVSLLLCLAILMRLIQSAKLRCWLLDRNVYLQAICAADVLAAMSGGDSFSDIYGLSRLLYVSLPQLLGILLGKRLVLLPQTYGPFRSRTSRAIARFIVRRAERVYARDAQSVSEALALLPCASEGQKVRFSYDVAFGVDPILPADLNVDGLERPYETRMKLVGLNISGLLWMGGYDRTNMFGLKTNYRDLIYQLVELFVSKFGANVLLVPHVFGTDPSGESDSAVCEKAFVELIEKYPGRLGCLRGKLNQSEIKYVIGACDFFVGSRMHACIAALSQTIPAVSLAYSDKFVTVMRTLGVERLAVDARTLSQEEIVQAVSAAYQQRAIIRLRLERKLPEVRRAAMDLFSFLDTVPMATLPESVDQLPIEVPVKA